MNVGPPAFQDGAIFECVVVDHLSSGNQQLEFVLIIVVSLDEGRGASHTIDGSIICDDFGGSLPFSSWVGLVGCQEVKLYTPNYWAEVPLASNCLELA